MSQTALGTRIALEQMPGGAGQTLTNKVISKVVNYRVDVSFSKGLIKPFYQVNISLLCHGGGSLSLEAAII